MLEKKNKDSFGIYIEFRTKLYKAIFNFQPLIFLIAGQRSKKKIFLETLKIKIKKIKTIKKSKIAPYSFVRNLM